MGIYCNICDKLLDTRVIDKLVIVGVPITSIKIDAPVMVSLARGFKYTFKVILNEGATDDGLVWTVSNPAYAQVDNNGNITVLKMTGTALLTVTDPVSGLNHSIVLRIL